MFCYFETAVDPQDFKAILSVPLSASCLISELICLKSRLKGETKKKLLSNIVNIFSLQVDETGV